MKHSDFYNGIRFKLADKLYCCTDVGSRTVVAICISHVNIVRYTAKTEHTVAISEPNTIAIGKLSESERNSLISGPPYALAEQVFDEFDIEVCEPEHGLWHVLPETP